MAKVKNARCKPAWCKGLRLVGVFFERWQKGGMMVAEVANCHLLMYTPFLCYTKQGNGEGVRHQLLTNPRVCGIIKKIGKIPPKVYVINC